MLTRTVVRTTNYFLLRTEVRADVSNGARQRVSQNVELFWGTFWTRFRGIGPKQANFPELIRPGRDACRRVTRFGSVIPLCAALPTNAAVGGADTLPNVRSHSEA
jgi:hypothetical protein